MVPDRSIMIIKAKRDGTWSIVADSKHYVVGFLDIFHALEWLLDIYHDDRPVSYQAFTDAQKQSLRDSTRIDGDEEDDFPDEIADFIKELG